MNQSKFAFRLLMAIAILFAIANMAYGQSPVAGEHQLFEVTDKPIKQDRLFFNFYESYETELHDSSTIIEFYKNSLNGKPYIVIGKDFYSYSSSQTFNVMPNSQFNTNEADKCDVYYITSFQQLKIFSKANVPVCAFYLKDDYWTYYSNSAQGSGLRATNLRAGND